MVLELAVEDARELWELESAGCLLSCHLAFPHDHVVASAEDVVVAPSSSTEVLLVGEDELRHVAGDEAGVPGEVEGALCELDAARPLAQLDDAEDPEDDEEGLDDGVVDVGAGFIFSAIKKR
jgi:hypothetical protein